MIFDSMNTVRYILSLVPFLAVIALHDAWRSVECLVLLSFWVLICFIIKNTSKSNEQEKKKGSE